MGTKTPTPITPHLRKTSRPAGQAGVGRALLSPEGYSVTGPHRPTPHPGGPGERTLGERLAKGMKVTWTQTAHQVPHSHLLGSWD